MICHLVEQKLLICHWEYYYWLNYYYKMSLIYNCYRVTLWYFSAKSLPTPHRFTYSLSASACIRNIFIGQHIGHHLRLVSALLIFYRFGWSAVADIFTFLFRWLCAHSDSHITSYQPLDTIDATAALPPSPAYHFRMMAFTLQAISFSQLFSMI